MDRRVSTAKTTPPSFSHLVISTIARMAFRRFCPATFPLRVPIAPWTAALVPLAKVVLQELKVRKHFKDSFFRSKNLGPNGARGPGGVPGKSGTFSTRTILYDFFA